ncbi:MAG: S8 family serine peptidase, partial [Candidatus Hodarchaeota archaeon]
MRKWNIIRRNSFIILILINTTFLCCINAKASKISNSKINSDISYNLHNSTPYFSNHSNYLVFHEPIQDLVHSIQKIYAVNDSFNAIYNQINPFLVKNESTGKNTTIAILDSGINNNSWISIREPRYTTITNSTEVNDDSGHGTLVAGIITKIAPSSRLISIKVTKEDGLSKIKWVEDGLKLALSLNVSLIHISSQLTQLDAINSTLLSEISTRNIPVVTSAGDYGPYGASLTSPAIFQEVIAVGMAYNQTHLLYDKIKASESSKGPRPSGIMGPDIVAPGINIVGYDHNDIETNRTGTSFAASFVTGGIALLKESFPNASTTTLKAAILDSAKFMPEISPIHQGNGFFDLSKTYYRLLHTNDTDPLFIFAPREISSYFTYFGHAINGVNRTYRISLYSTINSKLSEVNITQTYPSRNNQSTNMTDGNEFPIQIKTDKLNESLLKGFNILNISVYIPQNLNMAKRQGNVSFSFAYGVNNSIKTSNLTITIENRYPGGNLLFYQGYDNDSFIPNGPTGGFSQLQYFLEKYYGMKSEGAIRPMDLILAVDPLFSTEKVSGGISQEDLDGQDILVLSDIEFGISEQEITFIINWVLAGHSLLILSFPSQLINNTESLSNQTAINKLLDYYGITIEDDFTGLSRFNNGTNIIS